jgi:hypothetical protein
MKTQFAIACTIAALGAQAETVTIGAEDDWYTPIPAR